MTTTTTARTQNRYLLLEYHLLMTEASPEIADCPALAHGFIFLASTWHHLTIVRELHDC